MTDEQIQKLWDVVLRYQIENDKSLSDGISFLDLMAIVEEWRKEVIEDE